MKHIPSVLLLLLLVLPLHAQSEGPSLASCLENARRSLQADQPQLALEFTDYALRLDSLSADAWLLRIRICSSLSRYEEALEACIRLKACPGPRPVELYTRWIGIYLNTNNPQAALDIAREGLALFPQSFALIYNQGHALMDLGRYSEAYACYDAAFHLDPLADGPPFLLGMQAEGAGHLAQALLLYLQNLLVRPHSDAAPYILRQLESWLQLETLPETAGHEDFLLLQMLRELRPEQASYGAVYEILLRGLDVLLSDFPPRPEGYQPANFHQTPQPLTDTCRPLFADMRCRQLLEPFLHSVTLLALDQRNADTGCSNTPTSCAAPPTISSRPRAISRSPDRSRVPVSVAPTPFLQAYYTVV